MPFSWVVLLVGSLCLLFVLLFPRDLKPSQIGVEWKDCMVMYLRRFIPKDELLPEGKEQILADVISMIIAYCIRKDDEWVHFYPLDIIPDAENAGTAYRQDIMDCLEILRQSGFLRKHKQFESYHIQPHFIFVLGHMKRESAVIE